MKTFLLVLLGMCTFFTTQAQVSKTVNVTPGSLITLLTAEELSSVTNLTISGTIDARDFKTMRDEMTVLEILNLSNVTIDSYTGTEGTGGTYETNYPANEIPFAAFVDVITENGKTSLNSIVLPINSTSIGIGAFYNCSGLKSISIPGSISSLGFVSFAGCTGLTSITVGSNYPIELNPDDDIFIGVNKNSCTINVPYGAKEFYSVANGWNEFTTIIEDENGFNIGISNVKIATAGGSSINVNLKANVAWTASSEQSWITIDPTSGTGNQTITLTADANETDLSRSATITFFASGFASQILTVNQDGLTKTISIKAGGLSSALSNTELNGISDLKLKGVMDARDFKILRDNMPNLSVLDLTDITITAYSGTEGTRGNYNGTYPANTIPPYSFYNPETQKGKSSLTTLSLPLKITAIESNAFKGCSGIKTVNIPFFVTSIGYNAFANCTGLTSLNIPSSITIIDNGAFTNSGTMLTVDGSNMYYSSLDGVLFNKDRTTLIYCPTSKTGNYNIPSSVINIEYSAFQSCKNLTNITIPSSVAFVSGSSFNNCTGLISVDVGNINFSGIDGVLFNKNGTTLIKCPVSKTGSYKIPAKVNTIDDQAFYYCNQLSSINIPSSVSSIGNHVFAYCSGLTSIYSNSSKPVDLSDSYGVFYNANQSTCLLNVPYGAKNFYAIAEQWKDFTHIIENPDGFILSILSLKLNADEGSNDTVNVTSTIDWSAYSNQEWLTVSPASGKGNTKLKLTATANSSLAARTAIVTVSATDFDSQTITVHQSGVPKTVNIEAGEILSAINKNDLEQVSNLIITGTMDARDFRILRDSMPALTELDLSGVTVVAYSGYEGTNNYIYNYAANAIPPYAFNNSYIYPPESNLTAIILPSSINSIGEYAFYYCRGITTITIPQSVTSIEYCAFYYCSGLTSIISESSYPADLTNSYSVFAGVNKTNCTLKVPYQSKKFYSEAAQWKDFENIIEEATGFLIEPTFLKLNADAGSNGTSIITANVDWTADTDQTWLTVNPTSGIGTKTLTFTAEANTTVVTRTAKVTLSSTGVTPQVITINQEGIPKTLNVTAGGLLTGLTADELNGISNLTLTGTIDARDFKTMRDKMPLLAVLDISGANVVAYSGTEGTTYDTEYPANAVPAYSFYNQSNGKSKINLTSIVLPESVTSIGNRSFYRCTGLSLVNIPSSVSSIGDNAFSNCSNLTSLVLPDSLTAIERGTFSGCAGLTEISIPSLVSYIGSYAFQGCIGLTAINIPSSVTSIGSDAFYGCQNLATVTIPSSVKSIGESAFSYCTSLTSIIIPSSVSIIENSTFKGCYTMTSVTIPESVTSIGAEAFRSCGSLTSFTIPSSVTTIGESAFSACTRLNSITIPMSVRSIGSEAFRYCVGLISVNANSSHPVDLSTSSNVFSGINKTTCTLNIPYGSNKVYSTADQWKDFLNVVEATQGFFLDSAMLNFPVSGGSTIVNSTANVIWFANSDQSWLSVNPTSGTGDQSITFTAESNPTSIRRTAKVTFTASDVLSQTITITQEGLPKTIEIEAGGLLSHLTFDELNGITNLTITGTIDARDFKTMRDKMPLLAVLDLSGAEIVSYSGIEGTFEYENNYPANEVPIFAFLNTNTYKGKTSLTSVLLPYSATSIGSSAFSGCLNLTTIAIPSSVISIASGAFMGCGGLTSLTIPSSVSSIGESAFSNCTGIVSIYAESSIPIDLSSAWNVFNGIDKTTCTLNVPYRSKERYESAYQWQDFLNIVEDSLGFNVFPALINLVAEAGSNDTLIISANVVWTVSSDQAWLTVSPTSGEGNQTITLTAEANNLQSPRKAIVTISAKDIASQTITVTQEASTAPLNVTAGKLKTLFTADGLNSITTLKLTGTIDARDFKTMRDDMPNLAEIDLSGTTVVAYTGTNGTSAGNISTFYPENTIPEFAFHHAETGIGKTNLTSFIFPSKISTIGYGAFLECRNLNNMTIPESATQIDAVAFASVFISTSVTIPKSVASIGNWAFYLCNYIIVDKDNPNFTSVEGVLYNKTQTTIRQCPVSKTGNFNIPNSVTSIGFGAFFGCTSLTSINIPSSVITIEYGSFAYCSELVSIIIPSSVTTIQSGAFESCSALTSLYSLAITPVDLSTYTYVFNNVDKTHCTLYVPFGSKELYEVANQWEDFVNIVEFPFLEIPEDLIYIEAQEGSQATVHIESDIDWTASSNESWLTASPESGANSQTLTFTAEINTSRIYRKAQVTLAGDGVAPKIIYITQEGSDVPADVTPGGLKTSLTGEELNLITKLTLTGSIDARDFKTMRDDMPNLAEIDLSGAMVVEYTGTEGTAGTKNITYPANAIPEYAFCNPVTYMGKEMLASIILPSSSTSIKENAFNNCIGIKDTITIPSSITKIDSRAFQGCSISNVIFGNSLTFIGDYAFQLSGLTGNLILPGSLEHIGIYSFSPCNISEFIVATDNPNFSSKDGVLFSKDQTVLLQYPQAKQGSYEVPGSVNSIIAPAFRNCNNLTEVIIGKSVKIIESWSFQNCSELLAIYELLTTPIDLISTPDVFYGVDKTTCILYVPYGSKELYQAANQWKDFTNIVEMPGFMLSDTAFIIDHHKGSTAEVKITSNTVWSIDWNEPWMVVDIASAKGNKTATIKVVEDNLTRSERFATITVSSNGVESQTIIVTQLGISVGVNDIAETSSQFNCYPNPFADVVNIEILNPERKEITVDIYNLAGERIKNLVKGISEEKIDIIWNGTNDKGQKVAQGVYVCKMNNLSKKLILGGN